jgi:hypothetical protein
MPNYSGKWNLGEQMQAIAENNWQVPDPTDVTFVGTGTGYFPNSGTSTNITFPSGTQAGDTAIIVQGFSGYDGSGNPSNESTLSITPDSSTDYQWSESGVGGQTNYTDTVYVINSLTSGTITGGYLYLTTSNTAQVGTYGVATMFIVRNNSTPSVRATQLPTRANSVSGTVVSEASGNIPTSGINTTGLLINVQTDRTGNNIYSDTVAPYAGFIKQSEVHDVSGGVFSQPCYKISYFDYTQGGFSTMRTRYTQNSNNVTYAAHSIVISV